MPTQSSESLLKASHDAAATARGKWSRRKGSVMVMFAMILPFVLVPLVGLAIDGTMLYTVHMKLQTAVDGAALAAAQSLNSGLTFAVQQNTAQKTADQFLRANFVVAGAVSGNPGYWYAYNLNDTNCNGNPCVVAAQDDTNKMRTVSVTASVQVPLIFMRIMGFSSGIVAATGQASRRDVVLVLVLDRSSSMAGTIASLQSGATYFVSQFQPGRDRMGLVVYGGSAIVAYPPSDWGKDPPAGGLNGPDTSWANTPDTSASPNIYTSINNISAGSNTGTAEALMYALYELEAANQPGALNVIVLFTDGQPNGITANFNSNAGSSILGTSTCTYKSDSGIASRSMIGWMAQWGNFVSGTNINKNGYGIAGLSQIDSTTQTSVTNWLKHPTESVLPSGAGRPANGCYYAANQQANYKDMKFPTADRYGNSTSGSTVAPFTANDYKKSFIWTNSSQGCMNTSNGARLNWSLTNSVADACQVGLASWNAADMAAHQIHQNTTLSPVIYCLGYEGNGGDDPAFMTRLANIPKIPGTSTVNSVYDSTKPQGMYIQVQTQNDIIPAFQSVMAEILRLSN